MQSAHTPIARRLRKEQTSTEKALWRRLRDRGVAGAKFRRQQCFGRFILDFYCAEHRLNVEIDGGQHDIPDHRVRDEARALFLQQQGVRTLRFWNGQVRENLEWVLEEIRAALEETPHPAPLPQGEREPKGR